MKRPTKAPIIHVQVSADLRQRLDKRVEEEQRTIAQVVRRAVEAYLARPVRT